MIIMHKKSVQLLFVFIVLLFHIKLAPGIVSGLQGTKIRCLERERQALLKFKEEVDDFFDSLSSWGSEEDKRECCKWKGVGCNNRTGHVTSLDLHLDEYGDFMPMRGKISNSLLELKHLRYLDLSYINFFDTPSPNFGSLTKLYYLNLSNIAIFGTLSNHFRNLLRLHTFDLSGNDGVSFESLDWISHLSSLETLDLSKNNLSQAIDWQQAINKLPHLKVLRLADCSLPNTVPPSPSFPNSSKSLAVLDLSHNNLASSIFHWLSNFSGSLVSVSLNSNQLQGSIPESFENMTSLKNLDLSFNHLQGISDSFQQMCNLHALNLEGNYLNGSLSPFFEKLHGCTKNSLEVLLLNDNELHGSLPDITRFPSMRELDLSYNHLNGTLPKRFRQRSKLVSFVISGNQLVGSLPDLTMLSSLRVLKIDGNRLDGNVPESIGSLSELKEFSLSGNSLQGVMSEAHFSNLSKLQNLDLSYNSLRLEFGSNWSPPFQLDTIYLRFCNLGPEFPKWLRTQNFSDLDISSSGISDTVPNWFWDFSPMFYVLNISHNQMTGLVPHLSSILAAPYKIDLSFNQFEGPLPLLRFNFTMLLSLDLSNNMFSGPVSPICKISDSQLGFLDLSNSLLSGKLPDDCFTMPSLFGLVLADNKFSGEIPSSIGSIVYLETLSLSNNNFSGELPSSLRSLGELVFLDLSGNKLQGEIPAWIGESLLSLKYLSLQSNEFNGSIPPHLCQLANLQILDLSLNNLSGNIPKCLNKFDAMIQKGGSRDITTRSDFYTPNAYANKAWVVWKGRQYQYERNLGLLRIIDFAGNNLIGKIPEEVTALLQLVVLNLSENNLTGGIPQKIGQLKQLESLDLSGNRLAGAIPTAMANLDFLNYLDLSNNNFSGKIPSSTQLQSFKASAFAGNLALCGLPVSLNCTGDDTSGSPPANDDSKGMEENTDDQFTKGFYTAMGIGFSIFFWGVSGSLLLKRSWRHAYFQFLDQSWDWLYVKIAVSKARLQRKFQS